MPRRIAVNNLNTSTIDIMNVIRQNAPLDYQNTVPKVTKASDVPVVGEIILGNPAFSNHYVNALINRIAITKVQSMTFNNPYVDLKKGYLEMGETIEDIFVGIAKVMEYDPEKAESREMKRYLPDVKAAFYAINWRVVYPVTIQNNDLKLAFLSLNGMEDMIARIVDSVYKGATYDEFLLFKYMLIKSATKGKFYPVVVDRENFATSSGKYRGYSNLMTFPKREFNSAGVLNNAPRERQAIFMDSLYNGAYDAEALASAFNMDKISFFGNLYLIDDWTTFDNDRFAAIQKESDMIESVTEAELSMMKSVVAIAVDKEFFQVYDNEMKFTEDYVAAGMYWNYFLHDWKTVAYSPFAPAVVFVDGTATVAIPDVIDVEIASKMIAPEGTTIALTTNVEQSTFAQLNPQFLQTATLTATGIGVQPYGAVLIPKDKTATAINLEISMGETMYTSEDTLNAASNVGDKLTFTKVTPAPVARNAGGKK